MNKLTNPFTPGAGFLPPELAGRSSVVENGRVLAMRARLMRAERGILMVGPRGVGKTSLLKYLAEDARKVGNVVVVAEIQNDSRGLEELALKLRDALAELDYASKVKARVREAFAVLGNFVRRFKLSLGPIDVEMDVGKGDSGNLECDLSDVLLTAARAAKEAGTAIGLYVDELQNVELTTLSGIVVALHHAAQDLLPLYLLGSGLPTLRSLVAKSKTYAERMFNYEIIGALDEAASADAIRKPLRTMNVDIEDEALAAIYRASAGYPFFLQECGYQVWQRAENSPIAGTVVHAVLNDVTDRLDRNFFDVRMDRISEFERRFLRAMADVPDRDGRSFSDIAARLGRSANSLSMVRRSLIRKGVVYSSRLGTLSYTVPMFDVYLKRIERAGRSGLN